MDFHHRRIRLYLMTIPVVSQKLDYDSRKALKRQIQAERAYNGGNDPGGTGRNTVLYGGEEEGEKRKDHHAGHAESYGLHGVYKARAVGEKEEGQKGENRNHDIASFRAARDVMIENQCGKRDKRKVCD